MCDERSNPIGRTNEYFIADQQVSDKDLKAVEHGSNKKIRYTLAEETKETSRTALLSSQITPLKVMEALAEQQMSSPEKEKAESCYDLMSSPMSRLSSDIRSDFYERDNTPSDKLKLNFWELVDMQRSQRVDCRKEQEDLLVLLEEVKRENELLRSTQRNLLKKQRKYRKHLEILYRNVGQEKGRSIIKEELLLEKRRRSEWKAMKSSFEKKISNLEKELGALKEESQKVDGYGYFFITYFSHITKIDVQNIDSYGSIKGSKFYGVVRFMKLEYLKNVLSSDNLNGLQRFVKLISSHLWSRIFG